MKTLQKSVTCSIEEINPEKAEKLLATSPGNRTTKKSTVIGLINALKNGKFKFNGESIVIDNEGRLMDGHHRLEAVKQSGISTVFVVVRGIERDCYTTMDSGVSRTLADVFKIEGIPYYTNMASAIVGYKAMCANRVGIESHGCKERCNSLGLSRQEALDIYYKNETVWNCIMSITSRIINNLKGYFKFKEISVINSYLVLYKGHTLKEVEEFWNLVCDGDGMYFSLRKTFLKDMQELRYKKMSSISRRSYIAVVWNAYIQNKFVKIVRYKMGETINFI